MTRKKIPQAVICDPPEPTTIDESDLAPGMVVTTIGTIGSVWIEEAAEVSIDEFGCPIGGRACLAQNHTADRIRWVAGDQAGRVASGRRRAAIGGGS
jgi:hypothetical protein